MVWIIFLLSLANSQNYWLSTLYYENNNCANPVFRIHEVRVAGCSNSPCSGGVEQKCTGPSIYQPPDGIYFSRKITYPCGGGSCTSAPGCNEEVFYFRDRYCMQLGASYFKASCNFPTITYENFTDSTCSNAPFASAVHAAYGCDGGSTYFCGGSATSPPTTTGAFTYPTTTTGNGSYSSYSTTTPAAASRLCIYHVSLLVAILMFM